MCDPIPSLHSPSLIASAMNNEGVAHFLVAQNRVPICNQRDAATLSLNEGFSPGPKPRRDSFSVKLGRIALALAFGPRWLSLPLCTDSVDG